MGFMAILLLNVAPRNEVACPKSSLPFLWYFRMNVSGCLPTRSIVLWGPKCPVGIESGRASYGFSSYRGGDASEGGAAECFSAYLL